MQKKTAFASLTSLLFSLSPLMALAEAVENIGPQTSLATVDIRPLLFNVANVALGVIGIVSISMLIYGLAVKITAGGNEDWEVHARKLFIGAIVGIVLVLTSWTLFSTVFKNVVQAAG